MGPLPRLPDSRALLVAAIVLAGCSAYEPVATPVPKSTVRARLTVDEAVRWSDLFGEPVRTLQGQVVRQDAQGLHLDVLLARSTSEFRAGEFRDTLLIPAAGLEGVAERRFSPWRTALLGVGAAAAVYLIVDEVLVGGSDEGDPGDGGGNQQTRIPLVRVPIGR